PEGIMCKLCQKVTKHHRDTGRPSYSCDICGHHEHPTANTIFHKSPTPLKLWFYAIYLMASTRCGISAKQVQRETGVTYKTAWRMCFQIRSMLDQDTKLSGEVEMDEAYHGGVKGKENSGFPRPGQLTKSTMIGAVERGGRIVAKTVTDMKS